MRQRTARLLARAAAGAISRAMKRCTAPAVGVATQGALRVVLAATAAEPLPVGLLPAERTPQRACFTTGTTAAATSPTLTPVPLSHSPLTHLPPFPRLRPLLRLPPPPHPLYWWENQGFQRVIKWRGRSPPLQNGRAGGQSGVHPSLPLPLTPPAPCTSGSSKPLFPLPLPPCSSPSSPWQSFTTTCLVL